MAGTTTPKPTPADFPSLDALQQVLPLGVALSGGADSTAMLIACATRWPGQVFAVHVHHGLQQAADTFEIHCIELCQQFDVPLVVQRVNAAHASGESPEDAARQARYRALSDAVKQHWDGQVQHVVLAQHADDQVETLLLALSRGAGLPGLASMPKVMVRDGVTYHRPWLQASGASLRNALQHLGQTWVEDPTNQDIRYTRNRIRAQLLPVLEAAFPSFRETFARSAAHAAQAQELLQEVAEQDLQTVGDPPHIKALQGLSVARQSNVLRHWLATQQQRPNTAQLHELLAQLKACTTRGHHIDIKVGRGFVRRDGVVLRCYNL
ncbi:tRNA lysidine(34) synthetase TilS [Limnohabitans sp. JirII-29]|uniref:tRNA lysidine(34) synthetase TilS n=1 Tax=Limnohabitans sp. JirII-29 TaxID=1835756 RepID=UPI000D3B79A1|nr:tRNA lysidine(34) synthetase TilS [Limnohabitans sp. JirII-29]PUE26251.1 tRNA lysidine(34) synthetase TilS [Limnohabitans sp. JirII-29]